MFLKIGDIRSIAVLGAGVMGPGIAQSYAMGGFETRLWSRSEATLERAGKMLDGNFDTFVEAGVLTREQAAAAHSRISFTTSLERACGGVWYVQETIAEQPEAKVSLFKEVDGLVPPDALIVTNTSFLDPFPLMEEAAPARLPYFTTAHWYVPAQILPLVEVARGPRTAEETMSTVAELLRACGKTPARLEKFVPGYIVNRIQSLLDTEIFYLLDHGVCDAEQLDLAVKASFVPRALVLGLVQRFDFAGLATHAHILENGSYKRPEQDRHPRSFFEHVEKGELGIKTGRGFYDYGGRTAVELAKERDRRLLAVLKAAGDPAGHI